MDSNRTWRSGIVFAIALISIQLSLDSLSAQPPKTETDQPPADEVFALAASFYADQKWELAIPQFQLLLENHPTHELASDALFYMGESQVQSNQHAAAQTTFADYLDLDAEQAYKIRASFRLAECKYLLDQFDTARELFLNFQTKFGTDSLSEFSLPYLAELHLRFANPESAFQAYSEAIERFPESVLINKCRLGAAQAANQTEDYTAAEKLYRLVALQTDDPLADDAMLLNGKMHIKRGDWESAQQVFDELLATFPNSDLIVEARYLNGKHELTKGNWEASWEIIEPLLNSSDTDELFVRISLDAAVVAIRIEELERAQQIIQRVKKAKLDATALEFVSVIEIDIANRQNDVRQLEALVTRFEHQFKDSPYLLLSIEPLARKNYDRGEFALAAVRYQQLISLAATRPNTSENIPAWQYLLGLSRIGTNEYKIALNHLQAINDFGGNAAFESATAFAIGTAMTGAERWQDAIPHYRQYLENNPQGPDALRCRADLATALVKSDQLSAAADALHSLNSQAAKNVAILASCELVAELALKQNEKETAQQFFQIMADSQHPEYATRGANGLVWSGDESMVSAENLENLVSKATNKELALEAILSRVQAWQTENKHQQTVELLDQVVKAYPTWKLAEETKFRLAISLQRMGGDSNSLRASEILQAFVDENPEHDLFDLAWYELGWAKTDIEDFDSAKIIFTDITENHPDSPYRIDACYRAAMLCQKLGEHDDARSKLKQLITWAPDNSLAAFAHYTLGEYASQASKWAEARPLFETVIETATNETLKNPARYWLAESIYQLGDISTAEQQFNELTQLDFSNSEIQSVIRLRLAQCAAQQEDWAGVETIVTKARELTEKPTDQFQFDYLQARVFMSRAKFQEAREMFTRVIKNDSASGTRIAAMSQWMIGESWFHQEKYDDALRAYLLVDSLYEHPQWQSLALLQAAKCHLQLGDKDTAKNTCNRLLETFPDSPQADTVRELLATMNPTPPSAKTKTLPAKFSN